MGRSQYKSRFQAPSPRELETIITDHDGAEALVKWAERIGQALARQLATNQIRSLFGEVRSIQSEWLTPGDSPADERRRARARRNLILLKPKMAYRARKERGQGVKDLVSVLSPAIDLVAGDSANFKRFVEFFEAILAYHKAHGGS